MAALLRVVFACVPATAGLGTIIVTTPHTSLDATNYVFDAGLAATRLDRNASYALADDARFARTTWDCAARGTQGGVVTEKVLSPGSPAEFQLVRTGILNTPQMRDGEVFSTEAQRHHAQKDGKFEANAEHVLGALAWAKHGGLAPFDEVADRIVCAESATNGDRTLVGGGAGGVLSDADCAAGASALEEKHPLHTHATPTNGASVQSTTTPGCQVNATGSALFEVLSVGTSFDSLLLPIRPYRASVGVWSATALLFRADTASGARLGAPLASRTFNVSTATWVRLFSSPARHAPGRHRMELWPANISAGTAGEKQSLFDSPGWTSSTTASASNSSGLGFGGSLTFEPTSRVGGAFNAVRSTLAQRVVAAMEWQLRLATLPNGILDVLTTHEPHWRGVGDDDVGSAGATWDLIRSGCKDAYINARFLCSLEAALELQAAGAVEHSSLTAAVVRAAKAAFVRTFGNSIRAGTNSSSCLSWIACDRTDSTGCSSSSILSSSSSSDPVAAGELRVDIGFTPTLALAAALDVRGEGFGAALGRFDTARDAARSVPGRFRTNTISIEFVNVTLWRASSGWTRRSANGFAVRAADAGGDWHIFDPAAGPADGHGQFGNTEENGGVILATTALVFRAGVHPKVWALFSEMARAVMAGALQLNKGANGTSTPLMAASREHLRRPITQRGLVQHLCAARRGEATALTGHPDRWGEHWCNHYKSVSWNLPGAGSFVYAFARGLLRLDVAIAAGTLVVHGIPIPFGHQAATAVPVPHWAQVRWPAELRGVGTAVEVIGINVLGAPHDLTCTVGSASIDLTCTAV